MMPAPGRIGYRSGAGQLAHVVPFALHLHFLRIASDYIISLRLQVSNTGVGDWRLGIGDCGLPQPLASSL